MTLNCPITTGVFVRSAPSPPAAEEKRITPCWRVARDDGPLNPKLQRQAPHLLEEGYAIEPVVCKDALRA